MGGPSRYSPEIRERTARMVHPVAVERHGYDSVVVVRKCGALKAHG